MLYNPKWETRHHPLTIKALVAWLEKQDPTKNYNYYDPEICLAAQYNESIGRKYRIGPSVTSLFRFFFPSFDNKLERIAAKDEHTFGAALERARAYL